MPGSMLQEHTAKRATNRNVNKDCDSKGQEHSIIQKRIVLLRKMFSFKQLTSILFYFFINEISDYWFVFKKLTLLKNAEKYQKGRISYLMLESPQYVGAVINTGIIHNKLLFVFL